MGDISRVGLRSSVLESATELVVHEACIGTTTGALHDLPDQEPEEGRLAGSIVGDLRRELGDDRLDLGADACRIPDLLQPEPIDDRLG